jgi:hypothetical protein
MNAVVKVSAFAGLGVAIANPARVSPVRTSFFRFFISEISFSVWPLLAANTQEYAVSRSRLP